MSLLACAVATPHDELEKAPYGAYIHGLFLEGARWDPDAEFIRKSDGSVQKGALRDSEPKVLFTKFPVVWLKPRAKIEVFS